MSFLHTHPTAETSCQRKCVAHLEHCEHSQWNVECGCATVRGIYRQQRSGFAKRGQQWMGNRREESRERMQQGENGEGSTKEKREWKGDRARCSHWLLLNKMFRKQFCLEKDDCLNEFEEQRSFYFILLLFQYTDIWWQKPEIVSVPDHLISWPPSPAQEAIPVWCCLWSLFSSQ